jgi:predicted DNA-binding protein (UPF0251 family)
LTVNGRRTLEAIEPEEEREAFSLVRVQGLTQSEAAQLLGVSAAVPAGLEGPAAAVIAVAVSSY